MDYKDINSKDEFDWDIPFQKEKFSDQQILYASHLNNFSRGIVQNKESIDKILKELPKFENKIQDSIKDLINFKGEISLDQLDLKVSESQGVIYKLIIKKEENISEEDSLILLDDFNNRHKCNPELKYGDYLFCTSSFNSSLIGSEFNNHWCIKNYLLGYAEENIPGILSGSKQKISGEKTFKDEVIISKGATLSGEVNISTPTVFSTFTDIAPGKVELLKILSKKEFENNKLTVENLINDLNTLSDKVEDNFNALNNLISEKNNELKTLIFNEKNNVLNIISDLKLNLKRGLEDKFRIIEQTIESTEGTLSSQIDAKFERAMNSLNKELARINFQVKEDALFLNEFFHTQMGRFEEDIRGIIEDTKRGISLEISNIESSIRSSIESSQEFLNNKIRTTSEALQAKDSELQESIALNLNNQIAENTLIKGLISTNKDTIENNYLETSQKLSEVKTAAQYNLDLINENKNELHTQKEQIENSFSEISRVEGKVDSNKDSIEGLVAQNFTSIIRMTPLQFEQLTDKNPGMFYLLEDEKHTPLFLYLGNFCIGKKGDKPSIPQGFPYIFPIIF